VVTLAVYIYLIASLIGRRNLHNGFVGDFDIFPVLTFMEYFFYMGWLKVCAAVVEKTCLNDVYMFLGRIAVLHT